MYVLELENGKYYVGSTCKPVEKRFHEHLVGRGSAWTARYAPVAVNKTLCQGDRSYWPVDGENLVTVQYMDKHGVDLVRGGNMCYKDNSKNERLYQYYQYRYWSLGWLKECPLTVVGREKQILDERNKRIARPSKHLHPLYARNCNIGQQILELS